MPKRLICLLNGLFDRGLNDLGGLTPLQKARTPFLDSLAAEAEVGRLTVPEIGGHETALFSLLSGQAPTRPLGRACFEVAAQGFRLNPQQVAYAVRFASSAEGVVVDVDNNLLNSAEGESLCRLLNQKLGPEGFHWIPIEGPRAVLITDYPPLVEATDKKQGWNPWDSIGAGFLDLQPSDDPQLRGWLEEISQVFQDLELNELRLDLEEDPVNALLLYDGDVWPQVAAVEDENIRLWTSVRESVGVAKVLGIPCQDFGPEPQRFAHVRDGLQRLGEESAEEVIWELSYLWESTYKGDLLEKIKTLEWLDQNLFRPLGDWVQASGASLVLTALRQSDISQGAVVTGTVPLLCFPGKVGVPVFDEQVEGPHLGYLWSELRSTSHIAAPDASR